VDAYAIRLADGIALALPGWTVRCVERRVREWRGDGLTPDERAEAERAGAEVEREYAPRVRELLAADIDQQWTGPLALVRPAVAVPTAVLRRIGVPPIERDPDDAARFPDDVYGLTPASFADLDPDLADAGLEWGAAKAFEHKRRHAG